ncbi:e3 ubiquitin-protein ligase rha2a [Fagus crenata]
MSVLLVFSTIPLVSLFILIMSFSILRNQYSKLVCPAIMSHYILFIVTSLKRAWHFLLYHSFPTKYCEREVPDMSEELNIVRYEWMPGSSCEEVECAVCLCKIEDGEEIKELRCNHIFHRVCLDRWVGYKHLICPLCRGSLLPRTTIDKFGIEVLSFKFCSFTARDRETWWLR